MQLLTLMKNVFRIMLLGAALIVPSFLQAAGSANAITLTSPSVTLRWDKSPVRGVKGYHLRCGFTSGRDYARSVNVGNVTSYTLSNLVPGKTYYCVVTAYNAAGLESGPSNEISFTVSPSARGRKPTSAKRP
jgi:fibronectin type III domain protein